MKRLFLIISFFALSVVAEAQVVKLIPVQKNNKWGAVNKNKDLVVPFSYDKISFYGSKFFLVENNAKKGLLDSAGNQLLNTKYDAISPINDSLFKVVNKGLIGVVKGGDVELIDINFKSIVYNQERAEFVVSLNSKYGLLDYSGRTLIPLEYDNVSFFGKENYLIKKDQEFALVHSPKFHRQARYFDNILQGENLFLVQEDDEWGVVDKNIREVIPVKYKEIKIISDKYLLVKRRNKYAVFNSAGTILSLFRFTEPHYLMDNDVLWIHKSENWHRHNLRLRIGKKLPYEKVLEPINGMYRVVENNFVLLLNSNEEKVIEGHYQDIIPLSDTLFKVKLNRKWGVVNLSDEAVIDIKYDEISLIEKNEDLKVDRSDIYEQVVEKENSKNFGALLKVRDDNKYGVFTLSGKNIIEVKYDLVNIEPSESMILVEEEGLFGTFDREGTMILENKYRNLDWSENSQCFYTSTDSSKYIISIDGVKSEFKSIDKLEWTLMPNSFVVSKENKSALINIKNDTLIDFAKGNLYSLTSNFIIRSTNDGQSLYSKDLHELSEKPFQEIEIYTFNNEEYLKVKQNGLYGLIDSDGNFVVPVEYSDIKVRENLGLIGVYEEGSLSRYYDIKGNQYL